MRSLARVPVAAIVWMVVVSGAAAADLKLIANPSVKSAVISFEEIKGVFLATRTVLADGSRVEPVLLQSGRTHDEFVKEFIGKTDAALATYYLSLVFAGRGLMPKALASEREVADYVARTQGAVGYVSAATDAPGVKTLRLK